MLDLETHPKESRADLKQFACLMLSAQMLQAIEYEAVKPFCSNVFRPPVKRLLNHANALAGMYEREEQRVKAAGHAPGIETMERVFDANSILFRLSDAVIECPETDAELLVGLARLMADEPESAGYLRVLLRAELNAAKANKSF